MTSALTRPSVALGPLIEVFLFENHDPGSLWHRSQSPRSVRGVNACRCLQVEHEWTENEFLRGA